MMAEATLSTALDEVREILQSDGGDIALHAVDGAAVTLRLVVEGASCAECILPRELLEQVTLDILQRHGTGVREVRIDDPREQPGWVAAEH